MPPLQILVIEGLHPFFDERVRDLVDFKIYLDISDEIKFAWKIQRDMAERGHSLDSIKKSIEARKPDFDAFIDPQKKHADMIIQVRRCGDRMQQEGQQGVGAKGYVLALGGGRELQCWLHHRWLLSAPLAAYASSARAGRVG